MAYPTLEAAPSAYPTAAPRSYFTPSAPAPVVTAFSSGPSGSMNRQAVPKPPLQYTPEEGSVFHLHSRRAVGQGEEERYVASTMTKSPYNAYDSLMSSLRPTYHYVDYRGYEGYSVVHREGYWDAPLYPYPHGWVPRVPLEPYVPPYARVNTLRHSPDPPYRPLLGLTLKWLDDLDAVGRRNVAVVHSVKPHSPASRAGLLPNDQLDYWENALLNNEAVWESKMEKLRLGDIVDLGVRRNMQDLRMNLVVDGDVNEGRPRGKYLANRGLKDY